MKNIFGMVVVTILLFAQQVHAKEVTAVLLPMNGPLTSYEKIALTKIVVEELRTKFDLKHGEEVDSVVTQVFQDESKKSDCDETNCYRRIAAKYNAEVILAVRIAQLEKDRYLVTAHFYDVPTGEMTVSQKAECAKCTLEKLKSVLSHLVATLKNR